MNDDLHGALARYTDFFTTLTPTRLDRLDEVFSADARFRDPFNDVRGVDAIGAVFRHMYESCEEARFVVCESALCGDVGLLHWRFHYRLRRYSPQRERRIDGMSRVRFAADGRVSEHIDHWDAAGQVYESLPLLGGLLRWLRGRLAA